MPSLLTLVDDNLLSAPISLKRPQPLQVTGFGCSVKGTRKSNQDAFLIDATRGLFAVADGISGGARGEDAARMAIEGLVRHATQPDLLKPAIEWAQHEILQEALATLGHALMGTTLTALQLHDREAVLCHVGDSRCYQLSPNGSFAQVSIDHRVYDEKQKQFVLSSYLGFPSDIRPLLLQEMTFPVDAGSRILLCSDGLHRQLPMERVAELAVQLDDQPEALVKVLCDEAASVGERSDNVTVVYIEVKKADQRQDP